MASSPASTSTHLAGVVSQSAPGASPAPAPRRTPPPYSCTACGLVFDTVASLNVHIRYHTDNLLTKWATQQQSVGTNSNNGPPSNEGRSYDESPPLNNNLNSISKLKQTIQISPVVSPHPQPDSSYFHTGYPPQQNNAYGNNSFANHNGFHHYPSAQHLQGYKPYPTMPNNSSNGNDFNAYQHQQQQQQQQHRPPSEHQQNSQPSSAVDDPNSHAEILDLDSHKVHQVYPPPPGEQEEEASTTTSPNAGTPNDFPVHHHSHLGQHQQPYGSQNYPPAPWEYPQPQQSPMPPPPRYQETTTPPPPTQLQQQTQQKQSTPTNPPPQQQGKSGSGGASWKSNEARRPKTYNCTACNKWFTSSGHLKRHYNTTLHKNAVKSSGCPDPAKMPVSVHHHPARTPNNNSNNGNSSDSGMPSVKRMRKEMQSTSPPSPVVLPTQPQPQPTLTQQNHMTLALHQQPQQPQMMHEYAMASPHLQHPGLMSHHPHLHQIPGNGTVGVENYGTYLNNSGLPVDHGAAVAAAASVSATSPNGSPLYAQTQAAVVECIPNTPIGSHVNVPTQTNVLPAFPTAFAYVEGPNRVYAPWYNNNNNNLSSSQLIITNNPNSTIKNNEYFTEYYQSDERHTQNYQDQSNQYQYDTFTNADSNSFVKQEPEEIYHQQYRSPEYVLPGSPPPDGQLPPQDPGIYTGNTELRNTSQEMFTQTSEPTNHLKVDIKQEIIKNGFESHFQSDEDSFLNTSDGINSVKVEDSSESNKYAQFTNTSPRSDDESSSLSSSDKSSTSHHLSIELTAADSSHNSEMIITSSKSAPVKPSLTTDSSGGEDNTVTSTASTVPPKPRCKECDKDFNKACYLTQHIRCFHAGDKPFKCPRCGKRFPEKTAYQEHFSKHGGEKPHKCGQCPKQFNHKTDLRRHLCLHTGEKPYICEQCGKGFIRKDHMVKHVDTHRRNRKPSGAAAAAAAAVAAAAATAASSLPPPPAPPAPPQQPQQPTSRPLHSMLMATS